MTGPCEVWATEADLCSPCNDYAIDSTLMEEYLIAASEVLYELSGKQFTGECGVTIRPCTARSWRTVWESSPVNVAPYRIFGTVACGCGDTDSCGCGELRSIELAHYPVNAVSQVKVDGEIVDPSLYRVDDFRYLVRLRDPDGTNPGWPCCQDLTLDDTEEDTFSVSYTYGHTPPTLGVRAAAVLACELYMACNPEEFEGQCRLPRGIQTVSRQGVTVLVNAVPDLFVTRYGQPTKFDIWEIDLFLRTYNPYGLMAPTVVLTPDIPPRGKRVGT